MSISAVTGDFRRAGGDLGYGSAAQREADPASGGADAEVSANCGKCAGTMENREFYFVITGAGEHLLPRRRVLEYCASDRSLVYRNARRKGK